MDKQLSDFNCHSKVVKKSRSYHSLRSLEVKKEINILNFLTSGFLTS